MSWLRAEARRCHTIYARARQQGHGRLGALLVRLPKVLLLQAYRKLAVGFNGRVINRIVNRRRLRALLEATPKPLDGCFFVIVMPDSLHFLVPCLMLVRGKTRLCLLFNGAKAWERAHIQHSFPELPAVTLATLPKSSVAHGDVLSLLLEGTQGRFGVLDHDAYVFDARIFEQLSFAPKEWLIAYFYGYSRRARLTYPLTYFLVFNTPVARDLMARHGVDARLYKRVPSKIRKRLAEAGLDRLPLKDHHAYFDTLHLLCCLAHAEGWQVGYLDLEDPEAVVHVGGTSVASHATKALADLYVDLRFLELACNRDLAARYRPKFVKRGTAADIRRALPDNDETRVMLDRVDRLCVRLERQSGSMGRISPS